MAERLVRAVRVVGLGGQGAEGGQAEGSAEKSESIGYGMA